MSIDLKEAHTEVKRHLLATKPRYGHKTCHSDWKQAHEAAAKYLRIPRAKVTRIFNQENIE